LFSLYGFGEPIYRTFNKFVVLFKGLPITIVPTPLNELEIILLNVLIPVKVLSFVKDE
jgi:hypothetical protein